MQGAGVKNDSAGKCLNKPYLHKDPDKKGLTITFGQPIVLFGTLLYLLLSSLLISFSFHSAVGGESRL